MSATAQASRLVDEIAELVCCESPSADTAATARCADLVDEIARGHIDQAAERIVIDGRTHLRWQFGRPRVLLLGHFDTVWPLGTLARWPFSVDADRATGPGVFDMKTGVVQLFAALAALPRVDDVAVLLTSDEEIGSQSSEKLIESTARGVAATLVLEPSADGALKVARKGVGAFRITVTGRAAHAGLEPHRGINTSVESAHQILRVASLASPDRGTTVTPTTVRSGTTVNTVPAEAVIDVDVRAETMAEMRRVSDALAGMRPAIPGATVTATPVSVRPPLEPAASAALFDRAARLARRLGMEPPLTAVAVGGGSDGNFTAAAGVPTLDGLGAVGGNAHAEGEWVALTASRDRLTLLTALVEELLEDR